MEFDYNKEKNIELLKTRGVNFDDAIKAIEDGYLVADLENTASGREHQRVLVVVINGYHHKVMYVEDLKTGKLFLKTMYPSRDMEEKYGQI